MSVFAFLQCSSTTETKKQFVRLMEIHISGFPADALKHSDRQTEFEMCVWVCVCARVCVSSYDKNIFWHWTNYVHRAWWHFPISERHRRTKTQMDKDIDGQKHEWTKTKMDTLSPAVQSAKEIFVFFLVKYFKMSQIH